VSEPEPENLDPENLDLEAQRLVRYLAGRPSSFWAGDTGAERLEVLRHLVQALADLCADLCADLRPDPAAAPRAGTRKTPQLAPYPTLDLLLVVAHDLRLAGELPEAHLGDAATEGPIRAGLAEIVVHRGELDGTGVPTAWRPVVARARLRCVPG
jgi:hypothetical protein